MKSVLKQGVVISASADAGGHNCESSRTVHGHFGVMLTWVTDGEVRRLAQSEAEREPALRMEDSPAREAREDGCVGSCVGCKRERRLEREAQVDGEHRNAAHLGHADKAALN